MRICLRAVFQTLLLVVPSLLAAQGSAEAFRQVPVEIQRQALEQWAYFNFVKDSLTQDLKYIQEPSATMLGKIENQHVGTGALISAEMDWPFLVLIKGTVVTALLPRASIANANLFANAFGYPQTKVDGVKDPFLIAATHYIAENAILNTIVGNFIILPKDQAGDNQVGANPAEEKLIYGLTSEQLDALSQSCSAIDNELTDLEMAERKEASDEGKTEFKRKKSQVMRKNHRCLILSGGQKMGVGSSLAEVDMANFIQYANALPNLPAFVVLLPEVKMQLLLTFASWCKVLSCELHDSYLPELSSILSELSADVRSQFLTKLKVEDARSLLEKVGTSYDLAMKSAVTLGSILTEPREPELEDPSPIWESFSLVGNWEFTFTSTKLVLTLQEEGQEGSIDVGGLKGNWKLSGENLLVDLSNFSDKIKLTMSPSGSELKGTLAIWDRLASRWESAPIQAKRAD